MKQKESRGSCGGGKANHKGYKSRGKGGGRGRGGRERERERDKKKEPGLIRAATQKEVRAAKKRPQREASQVA